MGFASHATLGQAAYCESAAWAQVWLGLELRERFATMFVRIADANAASPPRSLEQWRVDTGCLMTPLGAEFQVAPTRELGDGWWEGEVLRAATSPDAPAVGSTVRESRSCSRWDPLSVGCLSSG
jgi:hypothetical protein